MRFQLLFHIFMGMALLIVTTHSVNGKQRGNSLEHEGTGKGNKHKSNVKSKSNVGHAKPHQPKRNDLIKEQLRRGRDDWRKQEQNMKSPEVDSSYHSPERDSEVRLEHAIERTDRKTLEEWYDYATSLKGLLNEVEQQAKKCGCSVLYEPIDDSKRRISHSLLAVSNKLRYGSVSASEHGRK